MNVSGTFSINETNMTILKDKSTALVAIIALPFICSRL